MTAVARQSELLRATDVSIEYAVQGGSLLAVSGASLTVAPGETVALVGDSGSGKSTLVLGLLGLTRPGGRIAGGSVVFDGVDVLRASDRELRGVRGSKIGFITQQPKASLNPLLRVGDQVTRALRAHRQAASDREAQARALDLFRTVGINDPERRLRAYPHELSGGMAQRVLIAIALAGRPRLLLADEPTSGLDVTLQAQILDELRAISREHGMSIVLVTHDLGVVANYSDRVYLMNAGEVVEECSTRTFFRRGVHPAGLALVGAHRPQLAREFRLEGLPVDRRDLPHGCWLSGRCRFAEAADGCFAAHPQLVQIDDDHLVRCHRHRAVTEAIEAVTARHA